MTLQADTSTTASFGNTGNTATITFNSVPANALLAIFAFGDADNGNATESLSVTTAAGLTWTRNAQGNGSPGAVAAIFTAPAGAGTYAITITDSDAMTDASSEIGLWGVIFTDDNGGQPSAGNAVADTASVTTSANNSWVWSSCMTAGTTNGTQTTVFTDASFDAGDQVCAQKQNSITATSGTVVTPTLGGSHGCIIEIKAGTAAAAVLVGYRSTPLHPGRGPSWARFYQAPRSTDVIAAGTAWTVDGTVTETATITGTAALAAAATGSVTETLTITGSATVVSPGGIAGDRTETLTITGTASAGLKASGTAALVATITGSAVHGYTAAGTVALAATITGAADVTVRPGGSGHAYSGTRVGTNGTGTQSATGGPATRSGTTGPGTRSGSATSTTRRG